ncbi:uncharacterized protein BO72DRAFT_453933 [Aspergillus fijiensis CBS 313.89]|uniref:Secreted protein n=1 Tax=Aspergillus fijiensis CBS 313.89 TaxID=1448319 RepID=A0A8G1RE03_9EURO|nr:uncharacterized protein BO72DRAFT_453933 [Aspergillus fijiensis CBS 313.89]RAK71174.1 hypothetical protein BO72DRAFT_453933 [Aspergillus fijiensis CBS 313.89]
MYRLQLCTALICPLCGTTTASLPVEIGCIIEGCLYAADKDRKYCTHRHTYSTTLQVPVPRPPSPVSHPSSYILQPFNFFNSTNHGVWCAC